VERQIYIESFPASTNDAFLFSLTLCLFKSSLMFQFEENVTSIQPVGLIGASFFPTLKVSNIISPRARETGVKN